MSSEGKNKQICLSVAACCDFSLSFSVCIYYILYVMYKY